MIEYGEAEYKKPKGTTRRVNFAIFEFCELGDMFDVVQASGAFEEELIRYYAK
jgi:hypothetical protein